MTVLSDMIALLDMLAILVIAGISAVGMDIDSLPLTGCLNQIADNSYSLPQIVLSLHDDFCGCITLTTSENKNLTTAFGVLRNCIERLVLFRR